jgi:hypothetical protein
MTATGASSYLESDGKAVNVNLLYTVVADQVAVVDGWLGITGSDGDSGDTIALTVDMREYQFTVPTTLAVAKGDIVYVEVADVTGHTPDDTAYGTSAGAGKVAFFKATAAKDANHCVTGIMLGQLLS